MEGALFIGPHGAFVSVWVMEMKAPATGKGKDRFDHLCAGVLETALRLGKVVGIEDHQWSARGDRAALGKAPSHPPIAELAIGGAVVGEGPAECLAVELARSRDVADGL